MKYWHEYVKSSYELVLEAEGKSHIFLNQDIESYLVHLMARWFDRNDIPPDTPVAVLLMTAMQNRNKKLLAETADVCLFYNGFRIKQAKWPSANYYKDMGMMAYGMAYLASQDSVYHQLEENFAICSKVLHSIKPNTIVQ